MKFDFFQFGMFAHPLVYGDYPEVVKERIARRSSVQGYARSRLTRFSQLDISNLTAGTVDFFGVNHYQSYYAGVNKKVNPKLRGLFADSEIDRAPILKPKVWRNRILCN